MERVVSHMRVYFFDENVPPIPAVENLIYELFYNEEGLVIKREIIDETVEYFYGKLSNHLLREVHDYPDGKREVTTYTYDRDGDLVCCHIEEQRAYDRYGNIVLIPTGTFSYEWYDWSNEGKTCSRTKENHYADGTVSKEMRREEYNDLGWLRKVHHFDEDFHYERFDSMQYHYPDGTLSFKIERTVFTTKEGKQREIRSRERYADDRRLSEENYGVNAEGELISNELLYEYEDDNEGNWTVLRQLKNGKVISTILREIEYW